MTKLKPHKNTHRTGVLYSFPRYPTLKKHHDSLTATFSSRNRCAESPFAKFWRPKKTGRLTREKLVVLKGDQSWISFFWCSKFGLFSGEILLKLLVFFFVKVFYTPKIRNKPTNYSHSNGKSRQDLAGFHTGAAKQGKVDSVDLRSRNIGGNPGWNPGVDLIVRTMSTVFFLVKSECFFQKTDRGELKFRMFYFIPVFEFSSFCETGLQVKMAFQTC